MRAHWWLVRPTPNCSAPVTRAAPGIRCRFPARLRSTLHAILIDPTQANVYFLAVSSETPGYAGVFRTEDEGATWQLLPGMEQKQVWALVFWSVDSRVIAAGTQDGVFLTNDGGNNWTQLSSPGSEWPQPVMSLAFDPTNSKILYAGTPHLAWKTADGGNTWRRLARGMQEDSDVFFIDVDPNRRLRLFAGACSGIYSSLDGGGTWSNLERVVGGEFRTYVIARAPRRRNLVFAGTSGGLMHSPDGGATWRRLSAATVRSIAFDPADSSHIFVATEQGISAQRRRRDPFPSGKRWLADRGTLSSGQPLFTPFSRGCHQA